MIFSIEDGCTRIFMSQARNFSVRHKTDPLIKLTLHHRDEELGTIFFKRGNLTCATQALHSLSSGAGVIDADNADNADDADGDMFTRHFDGTPAVQIAHNDVMSVSLLSHHDSGSDSDSDPCTQVTSVFVYSVKTNVKIPVASLWMINTMQYTHYYSALRVRNLDEVGKHLARRFAPTQSLLCHNIGRMLPHDNVEVKSLKSMAITVKPCTVSSTAGEGGDYTNMSAFAFDTFNCKNADLVDNLQAVCGKVDAEVLQSALAVAALVLAADTPTRTPTVLCLPYMTTIDSREAQAMQLEHTRPQGGDQQGFPKMTLKSHNAPLSSWTTHVWQAIGDKEGSRPRYVMWRGDHGTVVLLHLRAAKTEYTQRRGLFQRFIQKALEPAMSFSP